MKKLLVPLQLLFLCCQSERGLLSIHRNIVTSPTILTEPTGQTDTYFGEYVSFIGDANGDQYDDVLIMGYSEPGRWGDYEDYNIYIYSGAPTGISISPSWKLERKTDYGNVVSGGNFNGDTLNDILLGKHCEDVEYFLCVSELKGSSDWFSTPEPKLGTWLGKPGDFNNDGFDDVIAGISQCDIGPPGYGCAAVFNGSPTGIITSPSWKQTHPESRPRHFGHAVSSAGDVNGDGYDDAIVSDMDEDSPCKVYVYHGSQNGLQTDPAVILEPTDNQLGVYFGYTISSAGDVNGDGFADIIIGTPLWDGKIVNEGKAWVYYGSADGLVQHPSWWIEPDDEIDTWIGKIISPAGDVNGDGYDDVIIGTPGKEPGHVGRVYVYYGSPQGLLPCVTCEPDGGQHDAGDAADDAGNDAGPDTGTDADTGPQVSGDGGRNGNCNCGLSGRDGDGAIDLGVVLGLVMFFSASPRLRRLTGRHQV